MWVGVFLWANVGIPLHQMRVRVRTEAISGTPLLEQEFALREATVGKGLEVRIYSYTDRQPKERKNEYTLKLAVKCNQNNYAKTEAIIAFQAKRLCELTNASCQQKETPQAIFLSTHGHGRIKLFQTCGGRETTLALRMTTTTLIKQKSFVV